MRSSKRLSALALIVAAAGLSLTACGPDSSSASGAPAASGASGTPLSGGSGATPSSSPSSSSPDSSSGASGSSSGSSSGAGAAAGAASGQGSGSSGSGTGSGAGAASGSMCRTSNLTISTEHGISGEGMEIVTLKNSGSSSCTMRGYAGVDLRGKGDTTGISAARGANNDRPTVKLAPGQSTDFVLYYPYNNSGGTGYTFTTMVVTPPNETHSKTVSTSINIPVDNPDQDSKGTNIFLYPVGAGK